jgi:outer membrane protein OmpA-like peptidoglycan-associated protein
MVMNQLSRWILKVEHQIRLTILVSSILVMLSFTAFAQEDYTKKNHKYQRAFYKKHESRLVNACGLLSKKRSHVPHRSIFASHKKYKPNMAERSILQIDKTDVTADASSTKPNVKPVAKPGVENKTNQRTETKPKKEPIIEQVSKEKLEVLHEKEDEVLKNNNLPLPTSAKQAEVRKAVSDKLASKTNVYPLSLAPLYFQFSQDEFSVVDMEPFLMAAEYALQGRTVLIEGHTDSRGQDDYNVKLSIKRVQKIRQLMLDMGVPDERISVVGYGEELSDKKTKNEDNHQRSRRVDFTIF